MFGFQENEACTHFRAQVATLKKPKNKLNPYDDETDDMLVDPGVLMLLAGVVVETIQKKDNEGLVARFQLLLTALTDKANFMWAVWAAKAMYHKALGEHKQSINAREKQLRSLQHGDHWTSQLGPLEDVAKALEILVGEYLDSATSENLTSAKFALKNVISKIESSEMEEIRNTAHLESLKKLLHEVLSAQGAAQPASGSLAKADEIDTVGFGGGSSLSDWA